MASDKLSLEHIPSNVLSILQNQSALNNILGKDTAYISRLISMLSTNIRIMSTDKARLLHEHTEIDKKIKNTEGMIKINRQMPFLVSDITEIIDDHKIDDEEMSSSDELNGDENFPDLSLQWSDEENLGDDQISPMNNIHPTSSKNPQKNSKDKISDKKTRKTAVVKTSTRQSVYLPVVGLIDTSKVEPGERVGVNKDSYLVLEKLPSEFDSRVKAFEIDERPKEDYNDIGGLDKQIEELCEAIVMPMTAPEKFNAIGISPPKGVLLYGPPGTGKTLLARACAAKTNASFLKITAPQLVQMYTGEGARIVRDVFKLATEKGNCIIFIDEIDAIGTKRFDSEKSGDREVQRTMLELLNQLDGFNSDDKIKVIACTNRPDVLDPALMRSGRLDRKIEFPLPDENSRKRILAIHSKKMVVHRDVNFEELARSTIDFNGAQLKAVCVEAGMIALRRDGSELTHEDYVDGITQVLQKKKANLDYYA